MQEPKCFKFVSLTLMIFMCLHASSQRSYRYENFGNKSILLNGNVTGSVDDLGAVFYNPARLPLLRDSISFSIHGKFYELTKTKINDFFGDGLDISNSNFSGLSGMIAGTFDIKDEQFTYSIISRNSFDIDASYDSGFIDGADVEVLLEDEQFIGFINVNSKLKEEWFGLSWAKLITPNFSIGVSSFLSFYRYSGSDRVRYALLSEEENVALYDSESGFKQESTGIFVKIGVAWNLKNVELGLNIDLPYIEIGNKGAFKYEEFFAGADADIFTFNNITDLSSTRKVPLGINLGAGIQLGKHTLHFNLSWFDAQNNYDRIDIPELASETELLPSFVLKERLNSVFNYGFGVEIQIRDHITAITSFSSDFSPLDRDNFLFDDSANVDEVSILALDNFHYGLGVSIAIKKIDFVLGGVFTKGNSSFERTLSLPLEPSTDNSFDLEVIRWRILIGVSLDISKLNIIEKKSSKE